MKRLFLIIIFLLFYFSGFAQTFTLTGKVTKNDQPLPGTSVEVKDSEENAYTDLDGNYTLNLPEGVYQIIFTYGNEKTVEVQLDSNQRLDVDMTDLAEQLEEIIISAYRVDADSPITHSNLDHEEIRERNLGQDVPILMNYMPNVVTTSDAGAGIGYTGMRVRGSDASRINVTMNGIPINDAESHGTFWINLGDFTSSIGDLQLQRGVGTSTNGSGAFGASLNVSTEQIKEKPSAQITNTVGSFNTHKHQMQFNTGLLDDRFAFSGNFSILKSDGYIDRAFSDMKSYFLQGVYQHDNTQIKALTFGGKQQTYQAYFGIDEGQLKEDRRFNPAGMYTDDDGNIQFYDNQTDNYEQDHFQLLWNQRYDNNWSSNLSLHYTIGEGYYESYREDAKLTDYGLPNFEVGEETITNSDLVDRKWLDNYFYGGVFNLTYKKSGIEAIFGGGGNYYSGDHFGEVMYTKFAENPEPFGKYYDNLGTKREFNLYTKWTWAITDDFSAFADLQWRNIQYKTEGPYENEEFNLKDNFDFFNPKLGLTYQLSEQNQLYFSYARANREPNRGDYKAALLGEEDSEYPKAEQLNDYELGWRLRSENFVLNTNLYFMDYQNQLVLTGEIDPQGRAIRENSGNSYRAGIEIDADLKISNKFNIRPNVALSQNKNKDYNAVTEEGLVSYGNTTISFSPGIVAGNQIQYKPIDNLKLILLSKYVGEQYMSNTEEKAAKLDDYFVSDFNVQYVLNKIKPFNKIILTGLINNIFNEKYISNGYYDAAYGASYYPQAGTNFLAGLTLVF
ncbi:MAG TPA: TonB-dependent receptor [Flavobacteriaceae bacterium]|nr:TonB-dependent receptor [Flavobacteriaceae bacterium]